MSSFFNVLQIADFPLSVSSCLQTVYLNQSVGQSKNKTVDLTVCCWCHGRQFIAGASNVSLSWCHQRISYSQWLHWPTYSSVMISKAVPNISMVWLVHGPTYCKCLYQPVFPSVFTQQSALIVLAKTMSLGKQRGPLASLYIVLFPRICRFPLDPTATETEDIVTTENDSFV